MKFILEKTTVLGFVSLKIIVFSALIFVITGCQGSGEERLLSDSDSLVVETNISSPTQIVVTPTPTYIPIPSPSATIPVPPLEQINESEGELDCLDDEELDQEEVDDADEECVDFLEDTGSNKSSIEIIDTNDTSTESAEYSSGSRGGVTENLETVLCALDPVKQEVSCSITEFRVAQTFHWTSNATSKWGTASEWNFIFEESSVPDVIEISVEVCGDGVCNIFLTELDTETLPSDATPASSPVKDKSASGEMVFNPLAPQKVKDRYPVWASKCTNSGPVTFSYSPLDLEDMDRLTPYGQVVGGHVTPIDHMYFEIKDVSLGRDAYEVRAIQDALIYDISVRDISAENNEAQARDWRLDMAHTCTFASYLDLMTSVTPEIEEKWANSIGKNEYLNWEGISVKAGQVIGYIGGQALDFGVYDWEVSLPGLINPEAYATREPWKIHTVDPFQYYPREIRDVLLNKMIRSVEPRAGKIDYDVDGTPSGNWFQPGTDWYNGVNQRKYWEGHLSIAPHEIDPDIWRIGIGFLETEDNNFIMHGDESPLNISVNSGPVSYELSRYYTYIPADPDRLWWNEPYIEGEIYGVKILPGLVGTVLLELQENGVLKLEVFMGKETDDISGFTDKAFLYER